MELKSAPVITPIGRRFGIIIPAYNRRELLLETLESVRAQTLSPGFVVIVDDGSTDGTSEAAEEWCSRFSMGCDFKIIRQPNGGVSAARNRGAQECVDADLLAFLDSDDLWPADFVRQTLLTFHRTPNIVAATSDRLDLEYGPDGHTEKLSRWPVVDGAATLAISNKHIAYPSCSVFKASAFRRVGGFPLGLNYGEDYVFSLVVSSFGQWGRIDSGPTRRRKFFAVDHLSTVPDPDTMRNFAAILEAQAFRHQCHGPLKQAITHRWRRAGKAFAGEGRTQEARDCYARAINCDFWDLKARFRKLLLVTAR